MNITEYQNYHETKTHTASNFPYTTYLCSIPLDFTQVPHHWHEEMELIVISKGKGYVSVDFHTLTVNAGDLVLIRPGQLHSIEQRNDCKMEYENIIFNPYMLVSGKEDLCAQEFILPLIKGIIPSETFLTPALPYYTDLISCIRHIDSLCESRPKGYQLAVKGLLFQFMFTLVSNQKNKDSVPDIKAKSLEKLKTVLKYVEEHYTEPISIEEISSLTYYSKSHFMKFFKAYMNVGFTTYLNDYRLTMAARMLAATSQTVLEIAVLTGFDNLSYFNRLFKRKYGNTPIQYRRLAQNGRG